MNTVTITTALAIAITCMIIGFVTGGAIGYFNKDRRKTKPEEAVIPDQPPLADPAKFTELLRLWREKDGKELYVETSGHLLASSNPLNEVQKNRFVDLLKELAVWLDLPSSEIIRSKPSVETIQPIPAVYPAPYGANYQDDEIYMPQEISHRASEAIKTDPIPAPPPKPAPVPAVVPPSVQVQAVNPPPVYSSIPKTTLKTPVEPVNKKTTSMVEQIDDILQEIIKQSDAPSRNIRLKEEMKEGVIVWVGKERYIGIDTVPDQSVVDLIRAAVKEWDRRTENRLINS
ncbi:MAG TPA: hypothetical protein VF338_12465 [Leptolinea sp.]